MGSHGPRDSKNATSTHREVALTRLLPHAESRRYLATKRDRMGHDLSHLELDPVTDTEGHLT